MSYQQPPYDQQQYGYPPQGPPMQYQQPPPQVIVQEEKKDRGCLATWTTLLDIYVRNQELELLHDGKHLDKTEI
ncbi:hypothetical protein AN0791.2 [Aspergillus nidulans FGSC A4]|nr:hypothetical protein AN0791.2 [Aspergillus nidulans FGSC A4]|eukprot:XP_658395.1 hypothetical protein AN0791.2 [Aspergillus nidulans FGSC A4]